ncbi:BnaC04g13900D [Brassica napus]|uniref:BnaC04g13900D protein n=1 Tax=Brassica napus TaxID=3708 RepID=A0A078HQQ1_BRANA|nr:BnaC04g13900D [Brassica napus]
MAILRIFFSDLKSGNCSFVVEARLLRYWEARNVKRGGELMWIDMLLMDVNSTIMQATINANRVSKFRERLPTGSMYSVSGFDVARQSGLTGFRFCNQTELVGLANTNSHLPDVIGEITAVKSTVCEPPEDKNRVMVTVRLENDVSVTLSLFDAQAMVGGRLFLNATSGTHVYYDKETNAGESFFYRLVARDTGLPSAAPLLRSYGKLNDFIITAPSQDIDFLCTGRVSRVETDNGWCYVACSKCSKKLQRSVSSFECVRCSNPNAIGSLRYRVEMVIADDTAEGTFVCFDGVMTKLHNLMASEAVQLLAEEGVNPEDSMMPPFVAAMEVKTYTFQVRVTSYNFTVNHKSFTVNHKSFTVSRIINEIDRVPAPDFVDNGGDDNDDDDAPDSTVSHGEFAPGKDGCDTSKSAGKEQVGNARKEARVEKDGVSVVIFSCFVF